MVPGIITANHASTCPPLPPWLGSTLSNASHTEGQPQNSLVAFSKQSLTPPIKLWFELSELVVQVLMSWNHKWGQVQSLKRVKGKWGKTKAKYFICFCCLLLLKSIKMITFAMMYKMWSCATSSVNTDCVLVWVLSVTTKAGAFLLNTACSHPAEFTIMECNLYWPTQLITKHYCPPLQRPLSTFSSSHPPFMSSIDPWHSMSRRRLALLFCFQKACRGWML